MAIEDPNPPARMFRFSSFELDLRAGELRKHGLRVKLQDQPLQILALLLEKPGEVVTREQLRDRLWPADTFVDFDHSLNSAVKKLRQALNDDPDVPRFIETLPRRGYRFIAPVSNGSTAPQASSPENAVPLSTPAAAPTPPPADRPRHVPHWKLWAAGAFGFALALTLAFWFRPRSQELSESPIRLVPLTSYSGNVCRGSFSPDGNQIAFAWRGEVRDSNSPSGIDIFIKQIGAEKPLQLTQDFGFNFYPAWSPDGRYIAFLHWKQNERPGVYLVPALGGPPRKIIDFDQPTKCNPGLSWSQDGRYLVSAYAPDDQPCQLKRIGIEDLHVDSLTSPPVPSTGDWDPQYSPDGQNIAFIRNSKDVEDVYVMPAAGGTPRRLTFDNRLLSGLAWSADSKDIIFSSNRGGATWGLWRIGAEGGGTPDRLSIGSDHAYMPSISLKGNRLAYDSGMWNENIWRVAIDPNHRLEKPERLIYSSLQEEGPQYSPDGKRIVFQSTRSGFFEIWRADADGSNLVQLTNFSGPLTGTPRWSPDGKQISFDTRPGAHPNVEVVSADGGPPRRFVNDSADEGVASWSHDGRWLYFASNRAGSWQVWKRRLDGGQPIQVTSKGGFAAFESPDGKTLFYAKFNEPGMWTVPVDGGPETKILDEPPGGYWGYFAAGPDGLYFLGDAGTPEKPRLGFKFFDYKTRKVTNLGDMEKSPYEGAPGFSVSPDGRYLLYVQLDESRDSLMLADNFK